MHISFYPPLGSLTRVPVDSPIAGLSKDQDVVRAALTARLSSLDYAEVVRAGLRIEAWTNATSGTRSTGAWRPIVFDEVEDDVLDEMAPEPCLLLDANGVTDASSSVDAKISRTHVFRAALSLPRDPGSTFAFTYRLVYPSGICWLGSDRDNGVFELDAGNAFFEEIGSWKSIKGKRIITNPDSGSDAEDNIVIGKLDVVEWSWSGWATDGSRVWCFNDNCLEPIEDAHLVYLIPRALNNSALSPQAYVFQVMSKGARLSVTSQGHIVLFSRLPGASISYRVHDSHSQRDTELLKVEIISSCPAPQLFPTNNAETLLLTPNYDFDASVTIYALPLARTLSSRAISLPITAFDSFAKQSTGLNFYVPETRSTVFVDRSDKPGNLWLRLGRGGAQIVVSAIYGLDNASSNWLLSLPECTTSPEYVFFSASVENVLPTPPASPQTKPQQSVSFVLPSESETNSSQVRRRRNTEPSVTSVQETSETGRLVRSAFERYQEASGIEALKVLTFNMFKSLARFMGITMLRIILFVFRCIGVGKHLQARTPRAQTTESKEKGGVSTALPGGFALDGEANGNSPSGLSERRLGDDSNAKDRTVEFPHIQPGGESSMEAGEMEEGSDRNQERSIARRSTPSPVLKWILPPGDDAPIRLVVRSDVVPDDIFKYLVVKVNGEDVGKSSSVQPAGENTSVVETARPEGTTSALLVRLAD